MSTGIIHVLLSLERWDDVWRRNQQLASRIPRTLFVEPGRRGIRGQWRGEDGVTVITPAKPAPRRWTAGRRLDAVASARAIRRHTRDAPVVVWATHAFDLPLVRELGAPTVYDRTDDWPAMERAPGARALVDRFDQELQQRARAVVIVSEEMRTQTRPDAHLIPNGVDYAAFAIPPREHARTSSRIAYTGTVDRFRIDMTILRAIAGEPGVTLVVAGPGETVEGAENHGPLPHQRLPQLLAGCDALVAPYRVDAEVNRTSDSLKLYEYFATGLPVIATPTAGFQRHPDLVEYWPLSRSIKEALTYQHERRAQRQDIARHADWTQRAAAMREVLDHVAGAAP